MKQGAAALQQSSGGPRHDLCHPSVQVSEEPDLKEGSVNDGYLQVSVRVVQGGASKPVLDSQLLADPRVFQDDVSEEGGS